MGGVGHQPAVPKQSELDTCLTRLFVVRLTGAELPNPEGEGRNPLNYHAPAFNSKVPSVPTDQLGQEETSGPVVFGAREYEVLPGIDPLQELLAGQASWHGSKVHTDGHVPDHSADSWDVPRGRRPGRRRGLSQRCGSDGLSVLGLSINEASLVLFLNVGAVRPARGKKDLGVVVIRYQEISQG